jgi:hypothetical protein
MKSIRAIWRRFVRAAVLAVCVSFFVGTASCGCNESSRGSVDAGPEASVYRDARTDGTQDTSLLPDAAEVDATWPPVGVSHDFCNQPFFKLPIDGESENSYSVEMWGDGVIYQKRDLGADQQRRMYLFDLSECVEYLVLGEGNQMSYGHVYDDSVVVPLCKQCTRDPFRGSDLFGIDARDWQFYQMTDDTFGYTNPRFNGRYIVSQQYETLDPSPPPMDLILWDTLTDERVELASSGSSPGYYAISDRYAVWSAYMGLPGSVGKDVAYRDLQTGETVVIPESLDRYQYAVDVWGKHIIWAGSDSYVNVPFHLMLYDIDTGEATSLVEGDGIPCFGTIHENLVAWTTLKYQDPEDSSVRGSDIEMYDIESGTFRRITTQPSNLGHIRVFHPYLLIIDVLNIDRNRNDWYIANLVELGVTDSEGNLLSGPPVLDPP